MLYSTASFGGTYPFIMPSPFNLLLSLFIFWFLVEASSRSGGPRTSFASLGLQRSEPHYLQYQSISSSTQFWRVFYSLKIKPSPAGPTLSSTPFSFTSLSSPHVRISCLASSFPYRRGKWSICTGHRVTLWPHDRYGNHQRDTGGIAMGYYHDWQMATVGVNLLKR